MKKLIKKKRSEKTVIDTNKQKLSPNQIPTTINTLFSTNEDGMDKPYRERFNLDPPYQRDFSWPLVKKIKLIDAIIGNIGINAIHMSETDEGYYNVVDGKQRLTTLFDFYEGKFNVDVKMEDDTVENLSFPEIRKRAMNKVSPDKTCATFLKKFRDYQLQQNIYPVLNLDEQLQLFDYINQQETLSNDELRYCSNYRTKCFIKEEVKSEIDAILKAPDGKSYLPVGIEKNKKDTGVRFVHDLLIFLCGYSFDDTTSIREVNRKDVNNSAKKVEDRIIFEGGSGNIITQYNLTKIKNCARMIKTILEYKGQDAHGNEVNNLGTKTSSILADMFIFFFMNYENLQANYVNANRHLFAKSLKDFMLEKLNKKDFKSGTKNKKPIEKRYELFTNIVKANGISLTNGRGFTKPEKEAKKIDAPLFDPFSGELLTEKNTQVDHVESKNHVENPTAAILSASSNNLKSDTTLEMAKKIVEYHEELTNV